MDFEVELQVSVKAGNHILKTVTVDTIHMPEYQVTRVQYVQTHIYEPVSYSLADSPNVVDVMARIAVWQVLGCRYENKKYILNVAPNCDESNALTKQKLVRAIRDETAEPTFAEWIYGD